MILVILDTAVNGRSAADVQIICHPVEISHTRAAVSKKACDAIRHRTGLTQNDEGGGPPVSLLVPRVAPPVGWERQASMKRSVYSAAASVGGRTDTNTRPLALVRNSTRPLISANKV